MKKLLAIVLIGIFVFINSAWAEDYEVPHILEPGEILSSDIFNENFDSGRLALESFNATDLVGDWRCAGYRKYVEGYTIATENPWILSDDGMVWTSQNVDMRFEATTFDNVNIGDMAYPFHRQNLGPANWCVRANVLFFRDASNRIRAYHIFKTSSTRINLELRVNGNRALDDLNYPICVVCDMISIPPKNPKKLEYYMNGDFVVLAWKDRSDSEIGFRVYSKDVIDGEWAQVEETVENIEGFTEEIFTERWYRVKAFSDYGESLGTNIVWVQP